MLWYACGRYERLYVGLVSITTCDAICLITDILYTRLTKKPLNTNTEGKKMVNSQKEVQVKLMKGLLDLIVLQFLSTQPMHGYQVITKIRKSFGVYFGPSTIYPLLATLEKKGFVTSEWNMASERPRKVYKLTTEGQNMLNFTEDSLNLICRKMSASASTGVTVEPPSRTSLSPMLKKIRTQPPII
jgi:PadR family transcriptional regulator PadR